MPWGGLGRIWIRMSLYEDFQLPKLRLDAVGRVWWDLDFRSCGLTIPIATDYDWMRWGGFGRILMCLHVDESVHFRKNYDSMPWGGFGGIWISLHVD